MGVEHAEGELVTIPLAVELLGVLEQVDERVDELWGIVRVGHHRVGLHFTQITVPEQLDISISLFHIDLYTIHL